MRMGANVTNSIEYNALLVNLRGLCQAPTSLEVASSNIVNLFYIDFPNNIRQYMVDYFCQPEMKVAHYYFYVDKATLKQTALGYKRLLVGNQTFNSNSWRTEI